MSLTRRQEEVLANLKRHGGWCRPMDIGAYDSSYHSAVLNQLVKKGLVDRRGRGWHRSFKYKAVEADDDTD